MTTITKTQARTLILGELLWITSLVVSIPLHELGHAAAAVLTGVPVKGIELLQVSAAGLGGIVLTEGINLPILVGGVLATTLLAGALAIPKAHYCNVMSLPISIFTMYTLMDCSAPITDTARILASGGQPIQLTLIVINLLILARILSPGLAGMAHMIMNRTRKQTLPEG